jgi:hypothetical protein
LSGPRTTPATTNHDSSSMVGKTLPKHPRSWGKESGDEGPVDGLEADRLTNEATIAGLDEAERQKREMVGG